jgi:hypothetical protein
MPLQHSFAEHFSIRVHPCPSVVELRFIVFKQFKKIVAARMHIRHKTKDLFCVTIFQFRRVRQRFLRSADSLVRVFHPQHRQPADKAVRAPLVASLPRAPRQWLKR